MDLNAVANFKVLVVGDAIEDVYRFCKFLGRATKEAVIAAEFEREETYAGGVRAGASHLVDLCAKVDIWHGNNIAINVKYLGAYSNKLFSVHSWRAIEDGFTPTDISSYDAVIVFDFGYDRDFLVAGLRERLMREARFIAVTCQANSINYGFHLLTERWPHAHFAVCDELEARLAAHDQHGDIEDVILKLPYPAIIVTQGSKGAIGYAHKEFYREQALTDRPVDLLGAGDAVLAVVAPFAKAGFSIKELVHLGNVAGMIKVGILGHQGHVTKAQLLKHVSERSL